MKTIRWPLLLAFLATAAYGGQVYRSTDANGNVVFSDRPSDKSEPVNVAVPASGKPGNPITPRDAKAAAGNTQPGAQANAAGDQKKTKKRCKRRPRRTPSVRRTARPLASARLDTKSRIGCTKRGRTESVST